MYLTTLFIHLRDATSNVHPVPGLQLLPWAIPRRHGLDIQHSKRLRPNHKSDLNRFKTCSNCFNNCFLLTRFDMF